MDMVDRVIAREGGAKITNDPDDPGGLTKFGISQKSHPGLDIANLTYEQAKDIYIQTYYIKPGLQQLPEILQEVVFDYGVHSGPTTAIMALQKLAGVHADGKLGPATLAAIQRLGPDKLKEALKLQRILSLVRQVKKTPAKIKYLEGWIVRVWGL